MRGFVTGDQIYERVPSIFIVATVKLSYHSETKVIHSFIILESDELSVYTIWSEKVWTWIIENFVNLTFIAKTDL